METLFKIALIVALIALACLVSTLLVFVAWNYLLCAAFPHLMHVTFAQSFFIGAALSLVSGLLKK